MLENLWHLSHNTESYPTLCDPTRLLCPWDSPGKTTRVDCHSLLQSIFLTQGSNPGLLHCRQILYPLSYRKVLAHKTSPNSLAFSTGLPSRRLGLPSSCPGLLTITDFSFFFFFFSFYYYRNFQISLCQAFPLCFLLPPCQMIFPLK